MRSNRSVILAGLVCLLLSSAPVFAHHGYAAYDMTTTVTLKGTVTSFELANPHSSIAFDAKDDSGNIVHWVVETGAPVRGMRAGGFTSDTLKAGDQITITFNPGKEADRHIGVFKTVQLSDGSIYPKAQPAGGPAQ
ncbi:MAG: DUF6152 family protein [Candidatus Acidiferrales bacterium]